MHAKRSFTSLASQELRIPADVPKEHARHKRRIGEIPSLGVMKNEDGSVPLFKGAESFQKMLAERRIEPYVSKIRVRQYGQPMDDFYLVIAGGRLEHYPLGNQRKRKGTFNPEDVLSLEKAPEGWEVI